MKLIQFSKKDLQKLELKKEEEEEVSTFGEKSNVEQIFPFEILLKDEKSKK